MFINNFLRDNLAMYSVNKACKFTLGSCSISTLTSVPMDTNERVCNSKYSCQEKGVQAKYSFTVNWSVQTTNSFQNNGFSAKINAKLGFR